MNMLTVLCMIGVMMGSGVNAMKAYDCGKGRTWVQSMAEPEFCPYIRRPSETERLRHGEVVRVEKDAPHKVIRCLVTRTVLKTNCKGMVEGSMEPMTLPVMPEDCRYVV